MSKGPFDTAATASSSREHFASRIGFILISRRLRDRHWAMYGDSLISQANMVAAAFVPALP